MLRNLVFAAILSIVLTQVGCWKKNKELSDKGIKVTQSDQAFSVDYVEVEPGDRVSFKLFNGLKDEALKFVLLKTGEDPVLVQHIKAQQGKIPADYFLYESGEISPSKELEISFKAPKEEGEYAYVGVSNQPREGLTGRLVVKKKEKPNPDEEEIKL